MCKLNALIFDKEDWIMSEENYNSLHDNTIRGMKILIFSGEGLGGMMTSCGHGIGFGKGVFHGGQGDGDGSGDGAGMAVGIGIGNGTDHPWP